MLPRKTFGLEVEWNGNKERNLDWLGDEWVRDIMYKKKYLLISFWRIAFSKKINQFILNIQQVPKKTIASEIHITIETHSVIYQLICFSNLYFARIAQKLAQNRL